MMWFNVLVLLVLVGLVHGGQRSKYPSRRPTSIKPSLHPTQLPSSSPTPSPQEATYETTSSPSETFAPTGTAKPTKVRPTLFPSKSAFPSKFTLKPNSSSPSLHPTASFPTESPSQVPSKSPSMSMPTNTPTTSFPSSSPSRQPSTSLPTKVPSKSPSMSMPTNTPTTSFPSSSPSKRPSTSLPTKVPSKSPSMSMPTNTPTTSFPSSSPSKRPSASLPTKVPSTSFPTRTPTMLPSLVPTSSRPSIAPTKLPSLMPTIAPTNLPSITPTIYPTANPGNVRLGLLFQSSDPGFVYAADPNALVVEGTLYVFCSHDPDNADDKIKYSGMKNYVLFTLDPATLEWTNHGVILEPEKQFPQEKFLTDKLMFAPAVLYNEEDGYFIMHFPVLKFAAGVSSLAVARSRTPQIQSSWEFMGIPDITMFDPALFRDPKTNVVYLYGNSHDPKDAGYEAKILGGVLKSPDYFALEAPLFQFNRNLITEGVFVFYRDPFYYLIARVQGGGKDRMEYWMSTSPMQFVPRGSPNGKDFTGNQFDAPGHASVVFFRDRYFYFYHSGAENNGNRWKRSTCVDELKFNDKGEILPVQFTCKIQTKN